MGRNGESRFPASQRMDTQGSIGSFVSDHLRFGLLMQKATEPRRDERSGLIPVVLALATNERYFPGLYCAVASALSTMPPTREVDLKVLDGGISEISRKVLSHLVARFGRHVRLEFVPIDESMFRGATLGPGQSYMAYCRILLPQLVDVPRLIYLDCDVLVFRDLSQLFDFQLSAGKFMAAVPDSETYSLAHDSPALAKAMKLSPEAVYFNSGVMLMDLDELRKERFFEC